MQISTEYQAFTEPTLLLVTSRQDAVCYLVNDREMETIFEIHINKPEFRDNEEHFERRGDGLSFGSGSTEVDAKSLAYSDFLDKLSNELDNVSINYGQVILYVPDEYKNSTKKHLPNQIVSKITKEISGNLINQHPTELLKRLA